MSQLTARPGLLCLPGSGSEHDASRFAAGNRTRGRLQQHPQPSVQPTSAPDAHQSLPAAHSNIVSAHPDALRRRQAALKRKATTQAHAEVIAKAAWWESESAANLVMASSPQQLRDLLGSSRALVVVDFFSSWCTACRRLYPKLRQIADNNPDVVFVKVNVGIDSLRNMAESMGVCNLPYFQFYRDEELETQFTANLTSVNRIRSEIAAHKDCTSSAGALSALTLA